MARLFLGLGRGLRDKTGFIINGMPKSYNVDIFRPPFTYAEDQFVRVNNTTETDWTPWPASTREGNLKDYYLSCNSGTFILSGTVIELENTRLISVSTRSFTLSGSTVALTYGKKIAVSSGTLSLSGTAVSIEADRKMSAASKSLTLTGSSITIEADRKISSSTGSFLLSGSIISLEKNSILEIEPGELNFSGSDLNFSFIRKILLESDAIILTGSDVSLTKNGASYLSDALRLYNGIRLYYELIPLSSDLKLKIGNSIIGIPIVTATNNSAGAIRVKINGVVKALGRVA